MGGGQSAPSNTTSTSVVELPEWVQPYSEGLIQRAGDLSTVPYERTPNLISPLDPRHQAGLGMIDRQATQGVPGQYEAGQQFANTLAGGYMNTPTIQGSMLNANPYLDQMYNRAANQLQNQYSMSTAPQERARQVANRSIGNAGAGQYEDFQRFQLGENLGNLATDIYGGNYAQERGRQEAAYDQERQRQMSALGQLPAMQNAGYMDAQKLMGAGDFTRQYQQDLFNQAGEEWNRASNWPFNQLDVLGNAIGMAMGRAGSTTSTGPSYFKPSSSANFLGAGLTGLGALKDIFGNSTG